MTAPGIEINFSIVDGVRIVQVTGEVDMATAPQLGTALESFTGEARRLVVDLSAVVFLDSSGLNTLVHAQRNLAKRQIDLRVVSPAGQNIRRVFAMTQTLETLGIVESLADALA